MLMLAEPYLIRKLCVNYQIYKQFKLKIMWKKILETKVSSKTKIKNMQCTFTIRKKLKQGDTEPLMQIILV